MKKDEIKSDSPLEKQSYDPDSQGESDDTHALTWNIAVRTHLDNQSLTLKEGWLITLSHE